MKTRLTIISDTGKRASRGEKIFLYKCSCGEKIERNSSIVKRGFIRSCGCLRKESRSAPRTHGMTKTRTYRIWVGIKTRCENKKNNTYRQYGARGIKICKEWQKFENFIKDMGEAPNGLSIDRIDNKKGYSKENCRWVSMKQQQNNKLNNKLFNYKGVTKTMAQWADIVGIKQTTFKSRIKRGWSIERTVETPISSKPSTTKRKPSTNFYTR